MRIARKGVEETHALDSRNALLSISSAPGPIMSEVKDEVVFRM